MLIQIDRPSDAAGPGILTEEQRVFATARGILLQWRDHPHLLYDVLLYGAPPKWCVSGDPERNFTRMMRESEAPGAVNAGLTDAQYGEIYEAVVEYIKAVGRRGRWRQRKDCRIS